MFPCRLCRKSLMRRIDCLWLPRHSGRWTTLCFVRNWSWSYLLETLHNLQTRWELSRQHLRALESIEPSSLSDYCINGPQSSWATMHVQDWRNELLDRDGEHR